MTLAKAKTLASALLDAGCEIDMRQQISGDWVIIATRVSNPVDPQTIANLATAHAVTAQTDRARFS